MEIELLQKSNLVNDIWEFKFSKPGGFIFDAGDYLELSLRNVGSHWLSIASAPYEDFLLFTMKVPNNPSIFKQALLSSETGSKVTISPPMGNFNIPRGNTPILLIAAGIGITPFRSMLLDLKNKESTEQIKNTFLLYGAKANELIYLDKVEQSDVKFSTQNDRIKINDVISVSQAKNRQIYLAGPEEFCMELYTELFRQGFSKHQLVLSYFPGYPGPWSE